MMLSAHPLQARPFSPSKPHSQRARARARSSMVVEHVVLVKVKDDTEPTEVNAMVNAMKSLSTLDGVTHLTVGPLLCNVPTATASEDHLRFTHMLHSRYDSVSALGAYNAHPRHVSAVRGFLFPVCEDIMVVDWVSGKAKLPAPGRGSGIRVSFLKLKESTDDEIKDEVLGVVRGIFEDGVVGGVVRQFSCGENLSPERAKGFALASLAVFPGRKEMVESSVDDLSKGLVKVVEHVENVVVVDYVVPYIIK